MEQTLELEIGCGVGRAAVSWSAGSKGVFGSGSELDDGPRQIGCSDFGGDAFGEARREANHVFERRAA